MHFFRSVTAKTGAPEPRSRGPIHGDATAKARTGTRYTGALGPLRGRTYAHGRRHCSALRVPPAKEEKSLTAKAAVDAKGTMFDSLQERNAKTTPSMEMATHRARTFPHRSHARRHKAA